MKLARASCSNIKLASPGIRLDKAWSLCKHVFGDKTSERMDPKLSVAGARVILYTVLCQSWIIKKTTCFVPSSILFPNPKAVFGAQQVLQLLPHFAQPWAGAVFLVIKVSTVSSHKVILEQEQLRKWKNATCWPHMDTYGKQTWRNKTFVP